MKTGDKVQHKTSGEVFTVLSHEEATGNLRLVGHAEHQWAKAHDFKPYAEPVPAPEDAPAPSEESV